MSGRFVRRLVQAMAYAFDAESTSARGGYLQELDPRIKLIGLCFLIVCTVSVKSLAVLAALFLLATALALFSHIALLRLCRQLWIGIFIFTGAIALPACVLIPGDILLTIPLAHWPVSWQGLRSAAFLLGRAETAATFALLLVLTTPWTHVLKAMRILGVPMVLVAILGMTHRYIFVLLQCAMQMFEARRSRIVAPMPGPQGRRVAVAAIGVLLGKAFQLSSEVHLAMMSRGYRGDFRLLDEFHALPRDWLALFLALVVSAAILWFQ